MFSSVWVTFPRVADKSHSRLTVSCTVISHEGRWCSDGGCPCLSPGSLASEQVIPGFLCPLHSIFDRGPPCFTVVCHAFPGVGANIYQLHVSLAEIFELEVWLPSWTSALIQFAIQHVLKDATRIHLIDVALPLRGL